MDNNNNDNSPTTPNSDHQQHQQTTILSRGVKSLEKITTSITNAANTVDDVFTISPGNTNTNNRSRANSSGGSAVMQYSPPAVHDDDYDEDDDDDDSYQYLPHDDSAHFLDNEGGYEENAEVLLNALAPGEQYKDKYKVGQFDLCGSMWKRRGGLGRNAERNW